MICILLVVNIVCKEEQVDDTCKIIAEEWFFNEVEVGFAQPVYHLSDGSEVFWELQVTEVNA